MAEMRLDYAGEIAGHAIQPLTVTFLRGLLGVILEENVADVNAPISPSGGASGSSSRRRP